MPTCLAPPPPASTAPRGRLTPMAGDPTLALPPERVWRSLPGRSARFSFRVFHSGSVQAPLQVGTGVPGRTGRQTVGVCGQNDRKEQVTGDKGFESCGRQCGVRRKWKMFSTITCHWRFPTPPPPTTLLFFCLRLCLREEKVIFWLLRS